MDRNLALELVRVTEAAAISSSKWVGKGDSNSADKAAVEAMRSRLQAVDFDGTVVIGEGERDEAPMLYIGEKVGSGHGMKVDIAVDPVEGTNITAKGLENAISVLAAAPEKHLFHAPDTYMEKIAVGPKAYGAIDLDATVSENLNAVADKLEKDVEELTVVILDRDRHKQLIEDVRKCGSRIKLIGDGDVSGAIAPAFEESGVDILMGIGGAPEGVIAAAALKCLKGNMQARLKFRNEDEEKRATDMGISDIKKLLKLDDLAKGNQTMFVATGVTDGTMLKGVRFTSNAIITHSVVMRSKTGTIRFVEAIHRQR